MEKINKELVLKALKEYKEFLLDDCRNEVGEIKPFTELDAEELENLEEARETVATIKSLESKNVWYNDSSNYENVDQKIMDLRNMAKDCRGLENLISCNVIVLEAFRLSPNRVDNSFGRQEMEVSRKRNERK